MKKLLLFVLVATIAISGCKKDEDKPSYPGEVTINNVKTPFSDMGFFKYGSSFEIENYGDEEGELKILFDATSTGQLTMSESNYVYIQIGTKEYTATSGSITITQLDDQTVKGTFTGTFTDGTATNIQITGSFTSTIYTTFINIGDFI